MDSMRRNAQKMMPHVMALNKKPTMGMKNDRQPAPAVSKLVAFAHGGKVMAKGGAADKKQDKSMLARHNRLMHPGQKSKLMNGGMVKKYAEGGSVDPRHTPETLKRLKQAKLDFEERERLAKYTPEIRERVKQNKLDALEMNRKAQVSFDEDAYGRSVDPRHTPETLKRLKQAKLDFEERERLAKYTPEIRERVKQNKLDALEMNRKAQVSFDEDIAQAKKKKEDGYKKGGKVKCSPKKKGDKKKVMGTVGEAKALMAALQKARRPATPMPGTRMAGLGMAPPMAPQMAPPMKKGGKVMKKAAGGAAKLRKS
jgi:hypothetical protein